MELLCLDKLRQGKNLLAFSAGTDSTALFFLLMQHKISFDIAIVDYQLRQQSKQEIAYAKELAQKYHKKIYIKSAPLTPPSIEEKARKIRYDFFSSIIKKEMYDNLITAHQLNDQFEWFLMQFAKGAGVVELLGMEPCTEKEHFTIVRPLLFVSRDEIVLYLQKHKIKYFTDTSNFDQNFTRNFIRHNFSDPFIKKFAAGVKRSFHYLLEDKKLLENEIFRQKELYFARRTGSSYQDKRVLDKIFKRFGYLLSTSQKEEIFRQKEGVIASKFAFVLTEHFIIVAPYIITPIPKKIREIYRKHKIPKILRGYFFAERISPTLFDRLL
ncbi:tRNA(Ile)-lysidine synthase [Nitratiruptor tergarcus DSM 16512]|uniref:tRNA(Ile)-lysidine synthase n=1 Tax=Nitratiruptor tergarcus DSM 16512 TaxID=1069081 RepID=A0A1W1WPZ4_9BACT|nr:tRNA lysidine(34) synthetase TilS [Nitratiruptor tergarcus]SMC08285.1 tRNA(Ile)-lysidine synthase [Nitratiruptor tergarcus DSM 16512]